MEGVNQWKNLERIQMKTIWFFVYKYFRIATTRMFAVGDVSAFQFLTFLPLKRIFSFSTGFKWKLLQVISSFERNVEQF